MQNTHERDSAIITESVRLMNQHGLTDQQALDVALERESMLAQIEVLRGALSALADDCGLSAGGVFGKYFVYITVDGTADAFEVNENGKRKRS